LAIAQVNAITAAPARAHNGRPRAQAMIRPSVVVDATSSGSELEPGQELVEGLRLVALLGEGSMGSVWRAHHEALDTDVAVKLISKEYADDEVIKKRFTREARSTAKIKSPHVVQIFDRGTSTTGMPYMVMELLEGQSLISVLQREKRLAPRRAAAIVTQIAKALSSAHAAGIIHRDIKPENVFLVGNVDDDVFAKVLDFGVAKESKADRLTHQGMTLGTPFYMCMDQFINASEVTLQADLWSLSVLCYEALTGELPFPGDNFGQVMSNLIKAKFPKPSELRSTLTPAVDEWFKKAFHKTPSKRFQSAKELAETFLKVMTSVPDVFDSDEEADDWLTTNEPRFKSVLPSSLFDDTGEPVAKPRPAAGTPLRGPKGTEVIEGAAVPRAVMQGDWDDDDMELDNAAAARAPAAPAVAAVAKPKPIEQDDPAKTLVRQRVATKPGIVVDADGAPPIPTPPPPSSDVPDPLGESGELDAPPSADRSPGPASFPRPPIVPSLELEEELADLAQSRRRTHLLLAAVFLAVVVALILVVFR
jgi:serine/threonine-protein kinase